MAHVRKKILVVDGYNVLRSGSRYRWNSWKEDPDYSDDTFNTARERLINDVIDFAGREYQATIVFDGAQNEYSTGEAQVIGGVRVIFSPAGLSADSVIEKISHDARARGVEVMVVSSDAAIQDTVAAGGAGRISANGFSREMEMLAEDARADENPKTAYKSTIASRIDSKTVEALKRMRDGM